MFAIITFMTFALHLIISQELNSQGLKFSYLKHLNSFTSRSPQGRIISASTRSWIPTSAEDAMNLYVNDTGNSNFATPLFWNGKLVIRIHFKNDSQMNSGDVKYDWIRGWKNILLFRYESLEEHMCLHFHEISTANLPENVYFSYINHMIDYSECLRWLGPVGRMDGGVSIIYFNPNCASRSMMFCTPLLIMRALGFMWEHNRPDRDLYINVNMSNVMYSYRPLFERVKGPAKDCVFLFDESFQYDYRSMMHFGSYYFANDENYTTIEMKNGTKIGRNWWDHCFPNEIDKKKLTFYYNCSRLDKIKKDLQSKRDLFYPREASGRVYLEDFERSTHMKPMNQWDVLYGETRKNADRDHRPRHTHYIHIGEQWKHRRRTRSVKDVVEKAFQTRIIQLGDNANNYCLNFWYIMFGNGNSFLNVLQMNNEYLWNTSTTKQNQNWNEVTIFLNNTRKQFSLLFIGIVEDSGNIAIDDISVYECDDNKRSKHIF